jgi:hypothetical protein
VWSAPAHGEVSCIDQYVGDGTWQTVSHHRPASGPLDHRLTEKAQRLRKEAQGTPSGATRDELVRQAQQAETASHMLEWLSASKPPHWNMLRLVAMLAGPIVVTTIVTIVVFEIKDAWDRNRLR